MSTTRVNTSAQWNFHGEVLIEFFEVEVFRDFVAFLHIVLQQYEATLVGLKLSKASFCVNFLIMLALQVQKYKYWVPENQVKHVNMRI